MVDPVFKNIDIFPADSNYLALGMKSIEIELDRVLYAAKREWIQSPTESAQLSVLGRVRPSRERGREVVVPPGPVGWTGYVQIQSREAEGQRDEVVRK